jgi:DNA-binding MarR family transcriptional regulator
VTTVSPSRTEAIDVVAQTLLPRASLLTRLLLRSGTRSLSRTEAGMLSTLLEGPRRITELAETEAVAQPTVTQIVDKLQARGLVARERSPHDGRVVLVTATDAGRAELADVREQYRALMRDTVQELSDEEIASLVAASEALGRVIDAVQQRVEPR